MIDKRFVPFRSRFWGVVTCSVVLRLEKHAVYLSCYDTVFPDWSVHRRYRWEVQVFKIGSPIMDYRKLFDTYSDAERWLMEAGYL